MVSGDAPRRYIMYAATAPAVKVRSATSLLAVERSMGWFLYSILAYLN
jgi:hypothetical protein